MRPSQNTRASEVAQRVKVLAAKSDNLKSISRCSVGGWAVDREIAEWMDRQTVGKRMGRSVHGLGWKGG